MSKMKFNGVELELDLMDADIMEKYEYEIQKVVSDIQEPNQYKGKTTAQGMRLQCRYVNDFFDRLFGAGTASKLFEGSNNIEKHMEAFGMATNMAKQVSDRTFEIMNKYGPQRIQNREERRAGKRNNKKKFAAQQNRW